MSAELYSQLPIMPAVTQEELDRAFRAYTAAMDTMVDRGYTREPWGSLSRASQEFAVLFVRAADANRPPPALQDPEYVWIRVGRRAGIYYAEVAGVRRCLATSTLTEQSAAHSAAASYFGRWVGHIHIERMNKLHDSSWWRATVPREFRAAPGGAA